MVHADHARSSRGARNHAIRVKSVIEPRPMDRRLAQRNLISGLIVGGIALLAFGFAFFFAVLYITQ